MQLQDLGRKSNPRSRVMDCTHQIYLEYTKHFTVITTTINIELVAKLSQRPPWLGSQSATLDSLHCEFDYRGGHKVEFFATGPGWVLKGMILTLQNFLYRQWASIHCTDCCIHSVTIWLSLFRGPFAKLHLMTPADRLLNGPIFYGADMAQYAYYSGPVQ